MLSATYIIGRLGPVVKGPFRIVSIKRAYRDDEKQQIYDLINVAHWSYNESNPFYRVREEHLVSIKGRLEVINDKVVVIAEQVNYIEEKKV